MPDIAALIGAGMLLAAGVLLLGGLAMVLPPVLRVRRRAIVLQGTVAAARQDALAAVALLRSRQAETQALLTPWRRLLRWARHPLVVATMEWYLRRRRRRR